MGEQRQAAGTRRGRARSVVIIDSSPLARAGLRSVLEGAGLRVAGELASAEQLDARTAAAAEIAIVEAGGGATASVECLRGLAHDVRILVLAGDEVDVASSVQAGADGILLRDAEADQILAAVDELVAGRAVMDPALAFRALRASIEPIPDPDPLTPRELEVLRLLSEGKTNPQIASRLFLAVGTVKVHVEHILAKLGAIDRTDAAVRAVSRGLLEGRQELND